jgi:hypothetical protein
MNSLTFSEFEMSHPFLIKQELISSNLMMKKEFFFVHAPWALHAHPMNFCQDFNCRNLEEKRVLTILQPLFSAKTITAKCCPLKRSGRA